MLDYLLSCMLDIPAPSHTPSPFPLPLPDTGERPHDILGRHLFRIIPFIFGERGYVHQWVMPRSSRRCWKWPGNSEPLSESTLRGGGPAEEVAQRHPARGWLGGWRGDGETGVRVDEGEQVAWNTRVGSMQTTIQLRTKCPVTVTPLPMIESQLSRKEKWISCGRILMMPSRLCLG